MEQYLNDKFDLPVLKRFAHLGKAEAFNKKLEYLIAIAEAENWDQTDAYTGQTNSTIYYYIVHTFDRCFKQNKIYIDELEENAFFNTGLMTPEGYEIFGRFIKSQYYQEDLNQNNYWHFKQFLISNEKEFMKVCVQAPEIATYFTDFNELYFDLNLDIVINFDHIYDDNYHRLPSEFHRHDKEIARHIFNGFLSLTRKKIRRNNRIPIPQFYQEKIMFLIPIKVFDHKTIVIALEKINQQYRGNTILSKEMAYNCARLINKPESDWLFSSL